MELADRWCDNTGCPNYGKVGAGNLKPFSHVERRYRCSTCRRTSSVDKHTFFETVRSPRPTVLQALALLSERNSTVATSTTSTPPIASCTGSHWPASTARLSVPR